MRNTLAITISAAQTQSAKRDTRCGDGNVQTGAKVGGRGGMMPLFPLPRLRHSDKGLCMLHKLVRKNALFCCRRVTNNPLSVDIAKTKA